MLTPAASENLVNLVLAIFIGGSVALILIKYINRSRGESLAIWLKNIAKAAGLSLSVWAGIYAALLIVPGYMPVYTLTNGTSSVVFHGMQHVGLSSYYATVDERVRDLRKLDYQVLHEGLGAHGDIYFTHDECFIPEASSVTSPYIEQPFCTGGLLPGDQYADMSNTQMTMFYMIKFARMSGSSARLAMEKEHQQLQDTMEIAENIRGEAYTWMAYRPSQWLNSMKIMLSGGSTPPSMKHVGPNHDLIIDERNRILKDFTLAAKNKGKDVAIVYGQNHFDGFFELLKLNDPKWELTSVEYIRAI